MTHPQHCDSLPASGRVRPRLLFVVTEDWYFVSHRLRLAQAAVAAGFDVAVASRITREGATLAASGLEIIPLARLLRAGRNPWGEALAILELRQVYQAWRPDIIHHVAMKPVIYGSLAARLTDVSAVVNALAGLGFVFSSSSVKGRLLRGVIRPLLRLVLKTDRSRVILQNPDDAQALVGTDLVAAERVRLIRGAGVELERFRVRPEPADRPLVILAGRMLWNKGVGDFVEVARCLREAGSDARFALVGGSDSGNPAAVPDERLAAWDRAGHVEWWGRRDDMPDVFAQAMVVCLPSTYGEGVPKVLIEAAACGRPIVAYDIPGCREIVRHGENGLLVRPGDRAALAAAIRALLSDPRLRAQMGSRGREIAESEFSESLIFAQTLAVYRELCEP
jgi:glycosyltransferase involved in cell wall biosynthesis